VPDTLPVTDEAAERLREQAHQLGTAAVVRLIELLHAAVEDTRQGADPRLLLELALVKATRHSADISLDSLAFRVAALEEAQRPGSPRAPDSPLTPRASPPSPVAPVATQQTAPPRGDQPAEDPPDGSLPAQPVRPHAPGADDPAPPAAQPISPTDLAVVPQPPLELDELQEAWKRTVLPAIERRKMGIPAAALLAEAYPQALVDNVLTLSFPGSATFHRERAEEQRTAELICDALLEVTGRHLTLVFTTAEPPEGPARAVEHAVTEDEILDLMKSTFDARELED
jgi:DNA polymerase-3 subunit gamma/tau